MYPYIFTFLIVYVVTKFIQFAIRYKRTADFSKQFPLHPDNHPMWGLFGKVKSYEDFYNLTRPYVEKTGAKLTVVWTVCFWPNYMVTHPDTIKPLLKSNAPKNRTQSGLYRFVLPWIGDGLLTANGAKWERDRRLLTPAFHFDILKSYVGTYNEVVETFMNKLEEASMTKTSIDVYPYVSCAALDTMLQCTLSYKGNIQLDGESHPYIKAVKRIGRLLSERFPIPWYIFDCIYYRSAQGKEFKQLCQYVHDFADEIITSRKKSLAEDPSQLEKRRLDFLDMMLTAKDEQGNGLSPKEIRDEVDTFMFAGHDTTSSAISWAMHSLAKYPEWQKKIFDEVQSVSHGKENIDWEALSKLNVTTLFLKENMRMNSTVPITFRILDQPMEVEGVEFPVGSVFQIHPDFLNHNPAVWPDHSEFRPERFLNEDRDPFSFVPFSAGSRNCIGQNFAMNEQRVFIARVVQRFKLSLDHEKKEPVHLPEVTMLPKNGIHLKLQRR